MLLYRYVVHTSAFGGYGVVRLQGMIGERKMGVGLYTVFLWADEFAQQNACGLTDFVLIGVK